MPHVPLKGAFLKRGDFRIELFELPGAKPLPPEWLEVAEDLRTHGVQVAMEPMEVKGTVACYIRDNSGILVELCEPFPSW